ncbi:MAG: hypothetical protein ABSF35_23245 [Polyangia bacterium]|jgi:hypothetical protein
MPVDVSLRAAGARVQDLAGRGIHHKLELDVRVALNNRCVIWGQKDDTEKALADFRTPRLVA